MVNLPEGYVLEGPPEGYIGWILRCRNTKTRWWICRWNEKPTEDEILIKIVNWRLAGRSR